MEKTPENKKQAEQEQMQKIIKAAGVKIWHNLREYAEIIL